MSIGFLENTSQLLCHLVNEHRHVFATVSIAFKRFTCQHIDEPSIWPNPNTRVRVNLFDHQQILYLRTTQYSHDEHEYFVVIHTVSRAVNWTRDLIPMSIFAGKYPFKTMKLDVKMCPSGHLFFHNLMLLTSWAFPIHSQSIFKFNTKIRIYVKLFTEDTKLVPSLLCDLLASPSQ